MLTQEIIEDLRKSGVKLADMSTPEVYHQLRQRAYEQGREEEFCQEISGVGSMRRFLYAMSFHHERKGNEWQWWL